MRSPCKIEGCEGPSAGRGWCSTHWLRWRKYGDPRHVKVNGVDWNTKSSCSLAGCGRPNHARTFCTMHYTRYLRHGNPAVVAETNGRPTKGEQPTYAAIHKRLSRGRGAAREFRCVDCHGAAASWSYQGGCPDEIQMMSQGRLLAYSEDQSRYAPRCTSCHRKFDGAGDRGRNASGRFVRVYHPTADEVAA